MGTGRDRRFMAANPQANSPAATSERDLAGRGAKGSEVAVADDQDAECEDEGDGNHQAHVTPWFGPGHLGALPERDLLACARCRAGQQAPEVRAAEAGGEDERGDRFVGRGVAQLVGKRVQGRIERSAGLDAHDQAGDGCLDGRRGAALGGFDGGEQAPVGRHAVAQRLDPGGQGIEPIDHTARGGGLECGSQCPSDGPADGGADRPVGHQPNHSGEYQGAGGGLSVGGIDAPGDRQPPGRPSAGPDARNDQREAHANARAEEDDDRGHRPYTWWRGAS